MDGSDVIISCITEAEGLICPDDKRFKEGCLLIPVHTRGFQNCDLFFDKIFGDDGAISADLPISTDSGTLTNSAMSSSGSIRAGKTTGRG